MKTFLKYSKKLGSNFLLSQGPGGNTSIKIKEDIYIKKSGMYLSDSNKKGVFQKVNLKDVRFFYKNEQSDKKFLKSLSIETPLHVLLNDKYVFHYHSISSIITSLIYSKSQIKNYIEENAINFVDYKRPGYELALEVYNKKNCELVSSYFLENHGMIVSGDNIENVYKNIYFNENMFSKIIDFEKLENLINNIDLKVKNKCVTYTNLNPNLNFEIFNNKFFFPDHAVFLPFKFIKINSKNQMKKGRNTIYFDDKFLYLNFKINKVQKIYLKTLLSICFYIENKKIHNFINLDKANKLRFSDDEIQRIQLNK